MKKVIKKEVAPEKPYTGIKNNEFKLNAILYIAMLLLTLPIITGLLLIWFEIK